MIYTCSKQSKIDRLWGVFLGHLIQMQNAGIKVEYIRKGEVVLNGIRYMPVYHENTMSYDLIGKQQNVRHVPLTGHDIQPLINYLKQFREETRPSGEALEDMIITLFGQYNADNYGKVVHMVGSLETMGIIPGDEANRIISKLDEIDSQGW